MAFEIENVKQLNYEEVKEIYDQNEPRPIIIDVREHEEYVHGHIPKVPLIPMSQIENLIQDFDPNEKYILVCRSGRRSHEVAKFFKDNGIDDVSNYTGGMLEWEGPIEVGEQNIVKNVRDIY